MIQTIYLIILIYFLFGGIGFYLINRKKDQPAARKSYIKFGTYFLLINILFFSIIADDDVFRYLALVIIAVGFYELFKLFRLNDYADRGFFLASLCVFVLLAAGFYRFTGLQKELILFSFLILSIFDSFSQITGQLWGKTKILPRISPNKTLGGLLGGFIVAMASALLLHDLYDKPPLELLFMATGVVVFAFAGDLAASLYKRKYNVKDYSNLIPGHGGVLDRFDSLIAGGAWVTFSASLLNF